MRVRVRVRVRDRVGANLCNIHGPSTTPPSQEESLLVMSRWGLPGEG